MKQPKSNICVFCAAMFIFAVGCAQKRRDSAARLISGENAFVMLKEMVAIGPRHSGTAGARKTARYIADKCKEFGYAPEIDAWNETTATGKLDFSNVYAKLPGVGDQMLVVGTHFDTKRLADAPFFAGANDSASSTAVVLEIMRALRAGPQWQGPPVLFAFFDGEECVDSYSDNDGLHGSKRLANKLSNDGRLAKTEAMILLDMIGDKDLKVTFSMDDDAELIRRVLRIAEERGTAKHFGYYSGTILDDHAPFKKRGVPAIDMIDFEFGPNNSFWHTTEDNLDNVSSKSLQIIGDVTVRLLQDFEATQ